MIRRLLAIGVLGVLMTSCGSQTTSQGETVAHAEAATTTEVASEGRMERVDTRRFAEMLASGEPLQLVDVRTPGEYAAGHLQNSQHIDISVSTFDTDFLTLDKSQKVLVYCAVGGRSKRAAERMAAAGYEVYDLEGGIRDWQAAGMDVVKD